MAQSNRNGAPVVDLRYSLPVEKSMTFAGGTTNDPGDFDGTGNPANLFTVKGLCLLEVTGIVTSTLVGAATIEVGISGATTAFLAQVADATSLAAGEIWHDATPDSKVEASTVLAQQLINGGTAGVNVIQTIGTANITAGAITYVAHWYPLQEGSSVVAA